MAADDPVLGTEVLEVQPENPSATGGHRIDVGRRQITGERLDDDIGRLGIAPGLRPQANLDAMLPLLRRLGAGTGTEARKGFQVIDPQPDLLVVFGDQLPRQTPGHADVAVVVRHDAEDVPAGLYRHESLLMPRRRRAL